MLKIQEKDYSNYLEGSVKTIVRTFKGDILRTTTGKVHDFPDNFLTVGLDFVITAPKAVVQEIMQLCLSANLVEVVFTYNSTDVKGMFSLTQHSIEEKHDKGERHQQLTMSLVNYGSATVGKTGLTKPDGSGFSVVRDGVTLTNTADFGSIFTVAGGGRLNGAKLPTNEELMTYQVLVLGDTVLTAL